MLATDKKHKVTILSKGIRNIRNISSFFPDWIIVNRFSRDIDFVAGWGLRPSTLKARTFARRRGLSFVALEDGFLRSVGLGVDGWSPLSIVVDEIGIFYDTRAPSALEKYILQSESFNSEILKRAEVAKRAILFHKLSKYNHAPEESELLQKMASSQRAIVLVVDQTVGDMAITYGGANEATFLSAFHAALTENPNADIWVKTHPDVLSGEKQGYLVNVLKHERVLVFTEDINPLILLDKVNKVYCVTSQMGFEALMLGKSVTVFGLPWYAGWGLTDDRHPEIASLIACGRRQSRSLTQLFAAAYLKYSRYINPNTGEAGTIFDVINYLTMVKRLNHQLRGQLYCIGMSLWKRAVIRPFLHLPSCNIRFLSSVNKLPPQNPHQPYRLLIWGNGQIEVIEYARQHKLPLIRMEDGFIRSVGLGSNLVPPISLVADDMGIYFNPTMTSRLEQILEQTHFSDTDRAKALQLQRHLVDANISKYNVGEYWTESPSADGRTVILVPGQVEDDASIQFGSPLCRSNLQLLKIVRKQHPNAFIIYKPHPDVVSGNRIGHIPREQLERLVDIVLPYTDISQCLAWADEIHTMTSLTGFEGLLRGRKVYCYGMPFYAGWGLTHDQLPCSRRTRKLALWELIAGTLIYYSIYIHPVKLNFIDANTAIDLIHRHKKQSPNTSHMHSCWTRKQGEKLKQLYRSLSYNIRSNF